MGRLLALCGLALVLVASAAGKGFTYRVCGAGSCAPLPGSAALPGLFGVRTLAPPQRPGPYFELRAFADGGEIGRWAYVPGSHSLWRRFGTSGTPGVSWTLLAPREDARWRHAVRGLSPFAAPAVTAATLGGVRVEDPASYLAVYDAQPRVTGFGGEPLPLVLLSSRPTPWTGAAASVDVYPRQGVVVAAGTILVLDRVLAERLRARRSLRPTG
jgi:hypothetical protein